MTKAKETCREWLDTLVVAISVAMCFRAYFFEPFNIPTGSMQPTLWGYHTESGVERGAWDVFPLSTLKWLVTGEKVVDYKAPVSGTVRAVPRGDGFANVSVGTDRTVFKLPMDAVQRIAGRPVREGDTLWKGAIKSGDFIFVNRMTWNFRRPKDGDVMIFSTTGVSPSPDGQYEGADGKRYNLQQGTHYIKRMKATPGETYRLEHPVAGRPAEVTMGEDEYFACGDNFNNSYDSRYWGPVPGENLCGVGSFVFWPFTGWRTIK
ncbi:MAG: signal peptidase I [Kiritimatiellae bacterium]|nr:signal peptidase I [Kiritimatiellia bacterium]